MNNAMQPGVPNANSMNPPLNAPPTSLQQFNNPMQPPSIRMNNMVTSIQDFLNNSKNTDNKSYNSNTTSNANQFFPNIQNVAMNETKARLQQRQQVSLTKLFIYFKNNLEKVF